MVAKEGTRIRLFNTRYTIIDGYVKYTKRITKSLKLPGNHNQLQRGLLPL